MAHRSLALLTAIGLPILAACAGGRPWPDDGDEMIHELLESAQNGVVSPLDEQRFDAGFKANTRNRRVLEAWLTEPRRTTARSKWIFALAFVLLLVMVGVSLWMVWLILSVLLTLVRGGS